MVIPSNTALVNLCSDIYHDAVDKQGWDHLDIGLDDGVFWGVRHYLDYTIVVFRGSITPVDWLRDVMAAPVYTKVGWVHGGFYAGMEKMWGELKPMLKPLLPVVVAGHSLGASHANMLCGLMIADGVVPIKRMVVGEPRPGMEDFCAKLHVIKDSISFINGSKHRHDVVTDVPFRAPPAFPFSRPTTLVPVSSTPTGNVWARDIDPFALHHIQLYQAAVTAYDAVMRSPYP